MGELEKNIYSRTRGFAVARHAEKLVNERLAINVLYVKNHISKQMSLNVHMSLKCSLNVNFATIFKNLQIYFAPLKQ